MYTHTRNHHEQEGFSLIEIMVAVLIMGLVAAVAGPAAYRWYENSRRTTTQSTLNALKGAIGMYNARIGTYPSTLRDLVRQPVDEKIRKRWVDAGGPFLEKEKEDQVDGWGELLVYRLTPGQAHPYELYSKGPGQEDTKESRISVWDI